MSPRVESVIGGDVVVVAAATNAPDVLDAALTRPGRFDTKVTVDLPDKRGRKDIIDLYLKKIVAGPGTVAVRLARRNPFRSPRALCRQASTAS